MLAFWVSIAGLSLAQGGIVLLPAPAPYPFLGRLRSRWWALVPAASVGAVVAGISAAGGAAQALTYAALVGVPVLAALALGRAARGAAPVRAVAVVPLFALAWAAPASLAGEAAGLVLAGLSCVALGGFLAAVAPPRWLAGGIIAMAVLDAVLVAGDLLQAPNRVLDAAAPAAGLPQLQRVVLGSAQMGYGDLFIAAALGALLASARPLQRRAGLLAASFALAFDLLFLLVPELPATVPIAAALIAVELGVRRAAAPAGASPPPPPGVAPGLSAGSRGRAGP
ncbi:MAG: hypothetical protein QOE44_1020 [Solirubrobacteraceae bacterium]|nr:hypothetical protein [Solirubrobacteraceae bacterium]